MQSAGHGAGEAIGEEIQRSAGQRSSGAKRLQPLFHSLGLGFELGQVRLKLGDNLGLAHVTAAKSAMATVTAARTTVTITTAAALPAITAALAWSAITAAPAVPTAFGGAAALAAGLTLAPRTAFAVLVSIFMMVLFACLAVAHDQPFFRGLAERRSAMASYSAKKSPRYVRVLRISAAQVSRYSRPIGVSS